MLFIFPQLSYSSHLEICDCVDVDVGEAKSGVDFPPALLPLCDALKVFESNYDDTYSVMHQPSIVKIA